MVKRRELMPRNSSVVCRLAPWQPTSPRVARLHFSSQWTAVLLHLPQPQWASSNPTFSIDCLIFISWHMHTVIYIYEAQKWLGLGAPPKNSLNLELFLPTLSNFPPFHSILLGQALSSRLGLNRGKSEQWSNASTELSVVPACPSILKFFGCLEGTTACCG